MKFLVDENIPHSLIAFFIEKNYEILDVKNSKYHQANDEELSDLSVKENYIIITFDKDFLGIKKKQKQLRCIILNLSTFDVDYLKSYLEILFKKHKNILEKNNFPIFCKRDELVVF